MAKKRTNPNKIPLKEPVDIDALIREACIGNMYRAWLVILSVMFSKCDSSAEKITECWHEANGYVADLSGDKLSQELAQISKDLNQQLPYPKLNHTDIHTAADLASLKRKLRKNGQKSGMLIAAIGLKSTGKISNEMLQQIFFDADLTIAEIENGLTSYGELREELQRRGLSLNETGAEMEIVNTSSSQ